MARITVEDCLEKSPTVSSWCWQPPTVPMLSRRGHAAKIESKDRPGVTALREIAEGKIGLEMLKKVN